jgi:competence protein ComEC
MPAAAGPRTDSPATYALAGFCAGVLAVASCAVLPRAPGVLLAAGLAAGYSMLAWAPRAVPALRWLPRVAALGAAALGGFGYAALRAQQRLADELPPAWEQLDIRVRGIVDELPQAGDRGTRFAFAVEAVETAGAHVPARITLGWYAPAPRAGTARVGVPADEAGTATPAVPVVHAGERWWFTVRLKRPHGYVNPAGFDLEAWLLERNLRATGVVVADATALRVDAFAGRFADHVQRMRESVRTRILAALPGAPYAGVLVALAIGDQRAIPEAQWRVFNRTGVSHLISISGLHVTAFAALAGGLVFLLARRCTTLTTRLPARKVGVAVGAALATAYVLLAGAEVPAVRTLAMLAVSAVGLWLGRPGTASCVWLWSLAVVLVLDPWAGFAPGFWLSFGAVGLLLYAGSGRIEAAPSPHRHVRWLQALGEAARTQWVVTIGLVPGTLALFQQVSLVSAVANAFAIPIVTAAVVPLALAGLVVPVDAIWQLAHGILAWLMIALEWLSALPAAAWASHAPRPWTLVVALAGLLVMLAPRGLPCRMMGAAWLLPMLLVLPPRPAEGTARLVALDVGQGLSVMVVTARHALVYDTGPRFGEASDAGARLIVPVLRAEGIRSLDALVVSHQDLDHSGGALSLLDAVPVRTLWSSLAIDHAIVRRAAAQGTSWRCAPGIAWEWDDVRFAMLHPPLELYADPRVKTNDRSCVLRIEAHGRVALLAGDIEARTEASLVREGPVSLAADVLIVPHHGSRTSSTPAFVSAVAPIVAIVTAGYRNRFKHPRPDVVARYRRIGAEVPRTDRDGAIGVTLSARAPVVSAERREHRRYWLDAGEQ